ncbi:hypothetical protein AVEN_64728-1 [Araneus ventricosus]|uniref:Uncharacterized protein n=1 Tax=Araneus ventricosus TaxID=182803 RepID=A0A4Y2TDX3_ARAVE|nr:hypothetical protein AVEN_64728-1 [Araneus ventricosus]
MREKLKVSTGQGGIKLLTSEDLLNWPQGSQPGFVDKPRSGARSLQFKNRRKAVSLNIDIVDWKGCKALPVVKKTSERQPRQSYDHAAAVQKNKEEQTDRKDAEKKTDNVTELTNLKDSLQALKEVNLLLQEFPTLLKSARLCSKARTKQEKNSHRAQRTGE